MTINQTALDRAASLLACAKSAVFFTGAGVSKESGIPTFREAQTGLWANYNPEELATPTAFQRNPELVWQWYDSRRKRLDEVKPNPGHFAIAELEKLIPKVVVLTQNVDGLHIVAGSHDVVELHGSIREFFCFNHRHPAEQIPLGLEKPPQCHCGSLLRPGVVWFHEALPEGPFERARKEIADSSVMFVIGTSALVYPAAGLPYIALDRKIPVIEINPDETPFSRDAEFVLRGPSGEILPQLVQAVRKLSAS
jgi:NAD-dependent deacetylase